MDATPRLGGPSRLAHRTAELAVVDSGTSRPANPSAGTALPSTGTVAAVKKQLRKVHWRAVESLTWSMLLGVYLGHFYRNLWAAALIGFGMIAASIVVTLVHNWAGR